MAKCPKCLLEVPDKAEICGHCRHRLRMSSGAKAVVVLFAAVVFLGIYNMNSRPAPSTSYPQGAPVQVKQAEVDLTKGGKAIKAKHASWSNDTCNTIADKRVTVGMTPEQVKLAWGKPDSINSSGGAYGSHDQWCYPGSTYLYFDNGLLTSWQTRE